MKRKLPFNDRYTIKKPKLLNKEDLIILGLILYFSYVKTYLNFLTLIDFDTNLIVFS